MRTRSFRRAAMPSRATCGEKLVCTARVSRAARDDDVVRNARAPLDARGRRRGGWRRAFGERAPSRMVNSQISVVEPRSSRGPSDRLPIRKTPLGGSFRGFSHLRKSYGVQSRVSPVTFILTGFPP